MKPKYQNSRRLRARVTRFYRSETAPKWIRIHDSFVDIRDATENDLAAIVAIYNATVASRMVTADLEPVTVESRREWLRAHDRRQPLWVLDDAGQVCGWLGFQQFRPRAGYRPTAELSLYVAAHMRRRGLGRRLLGEAIARAPSLGYRSLVGVLFAHNTPSLRLIEQAGFHPWGHLPGVCELDGIERDIMIVGRRTPG
jgi:phosphinothricin acetyltransferase